METYESGSWPTPDEARKALELANAEEIATMNRPVPGWYYPLLAGLILVLFLLNFLSSAVEETQQPARVGLAVVTVATALTIAVMVGRVSFGSSPYRGVTVPWGQVIIGVMVAAALAVIPVLLADTVGDWIWAVCGLVLAALIGGFGIAYWRRYRNG